jgi:hypothetical protein
MRFAATSVHSPLKTRITARGARIIDPIAASARATADRLAAEYGHGLAAEVEAALYSSRQARPPERYLDPVSLGSLIVSMTTLAWTIYTDLRRKSPDATPDILARTLRAELRTSGTTSAPDDKITEVVITEVIRAGGDADEGYR